MAAPSLSLGGGYTFVNNDPEQGNQQPDFNGPFDGTLFGPGLPSNGIRVNGVSRATGTDTFHADGNFSFDGQSGNFSCDVNHATGTFSGDNCGIVGFALSGGGTSAQAQNSALISTQTNRAGAQQQVMLIQRRIELALARLGKGVRAADAAPAQSANIARTQGFTGVSAGDGGLEKSVWATYSHSWLSNDLTGLQSSGAIDTGIVGGDIKLNDQILAGITLTYQSTGLDTRFNDGSFDSGAFSLVPYGALALLDGHLILDLMTGYGFADNEVARNRSGLLAAKGSYHSDRWLLSTNGTYYYPIDRLTLSAKLGWLMSYEWSKAYYEDIGTRINAQTSRVGELSIGGKAAYAFDTVEPYLGLAYAYDPILGPSTLTATGARLDRDEIQGLVGLNWTPTEGITASLEGSRNFLRERQSATTIAASLRIEF